MNLPFFYWIKDFLNIYLRIEKPHTMKTSHSGIELIKKYEGFRSEPYLDAVGVPTIGYGATYYPNGKRVTMNDEPISIAYAEELLREMLRDFEEGVCRTITSELTQHQFDALVSISYNIGIRAFAQSTLAKRVNANPNNPDIRYQFSRWNKAGGKVLAGLTRRRKEEANLYFL